MSEHYAQELSRLRSQNTIAIAADYWFKLKNFTASKTHLDNLNTIIKNCNRISDCQYLNYMKGLLEGQFYMKEEKGQTFSGLLETPYQVKMYDDFDIYKNLVVSKIEDRKWLDQISELEGKAQMESEAEKARIKFQIENIQLKYL